MMNLIDGYLLESEYEVVRKFNHEPNSFNYETYIQDSLQRFAKRKAHIIETKPEKLELGKVKKYGHKTDKELNIHKGGIIRWL